MRSPRFYAQLVPCSSMPFYGSCFPVHLWELVPYSSMGVGSLFIYGSWFPVHLWDVISYSRFDSASPVDQSMFFADCQRSIRIGLLDCWLSFVFMRAYLFAMSLFYRQSEILFWCS